MINAYTSFKSLVAPPRVDVVTIDLVNADGTSNATTLAGVAIKVKGDGVAAGSKAFIRGNEILRKAPNHAIQVLVV